MKDYLNSDEMFTLMKILRLYNDIEAELLDNWLPRKNLNKQEAHYIRLSLTWGLKAVKSIIHRQDQKTREKINRHSEKLVFRTMDQFTYNQLEKKLNEEIATAREKEEYICDILEVTFDTCCKGCTKTCEGCSLYDYLMDKNIEEYSMEHFEGKKCRYAYIKEAR